MKYLSLIIIVSLIFIVSCGSGNFFKVTTGEYCLRISGLSDKSHIIRGTLANGFNMPWNYEQFFSGTEVEVSLDSILTSEGDFYLEIITIEETNPDSLYRVPTDAIVEIVSSTGTEFLVNDLQTANEIIYFSEEDSLIIPRNYQWWISYDPDSNPPITCQPINLITVTVEIPDSFEGEYWIIYHTGSAFEKSIFESREINLWIPETTLYAMEIFNDNWQEVDSIKISTMLDTLILDERYSINGNDVFIFELDDGYPKKLNK